MALAGDNVSAFGGIIALNREVDAETAAGMDTIFFEVCAAPSYTQDALDILMKKKNRMILRTKPFQRTPEQVKSVLNGSLYQNWDEKTASPEDLKPVTKVKPSESQIQDLIFANKIVKHAKSNTIVLAKGNQLIGIGVGQTSRVDALRQAIAKAETFGFSTEGAVMASDAFFPFPDCVEIADKAGIKAVIQPGGSIKDQESIDYCDAHGMAMVTTGTRHFKH
jgi:phosphoribosylaminoimidazolecarboxamide formyltransferase/IMP cyclohydrolase